VLNGGQIMAGYSETPLVKKLGLAAGQRAFVENAPADYLALLDPLPEEIKFAERLIGRLDFIHLFVTAESRLHERLPIMLSKLNADGMIWISWPKKAAKVPTDVTEDTIRAVALPLGLVDVKVCAVDAMWSGLKLVIRKELRKK
jgi:hypothetical protein